MARTMQTARRSTSKSGPRPSGKPRKPAHGKDKAADGGTKAVGKAGKVSPGARKRAVPVPGGRILRPRAAKKEEVGSGGR